MNDKIKEIIQSLTESIEDDDLGSFGYFRDQLEKEVLSSREVLCNKCGESCKISQGKDFYGEELENLYGLIDCVAQGFYGSTHLDDLTKYKFSMCESCLKQLFDSFDIPVEEFEMI